MRLSKTLNTFTNGVTIDDHRIKYFTIISRDLDRANSQYLAALKTLRAIRQPSMNVKISAETAFVAENQQLNAISSK